FTVDADRHQPPIGYVRRRISLLDAVMVEKIVFLALISVIFAQVLPDVRSSDLGIAVGVALLVVLNAIVSELLYRRGRSWTTSVEAFLAMLAINVGIVFADSLLSPRSDSPTLNTLFFVLLLSL